MASGRSRPDLLGRQRAPPPHGFPQRSSQRTAARPRRSRLLTRETEQQVLGPDVVVLQRARLVLREDDDLSSALGEPPEHGHERSPPARNGLGPSRGRRELGGANLHDLVLERLPPRRLDLDSLALLLAEDRPADGRLVREL